MTLCAAWIRNGDDGEELIIATDSRLTGGEEWDGGPKLFDLGRGDCLLCFTGDTMRAYPMMLHSAISIQHDAQLSNPRFDVHEVKDHLIDLFNDLCRQILNGPSGKTQEDLAAEARFVFAGWSWREGHFNIWRLIFSKDAKGFVPEIVYEGVPGSKAFVYLGDKDKDDKEGLAEARLKVIREESGQPLEGNLGMEPAKVLIEMIRENAMQTIGGRLQLAKVYRSGQTEFFGVMWPSENGDPTFLGRRVNPYFAPRVRFIDPDTLDFTETLPYIFPDLEQYDFGVEDDFVRGCYPKGQAADPTLVKSLTEAKRERLQRILETQSFREFKEARRKSQSSEGVETTDA